MSATAWDTYDPHTFKALTFYDATPHFRDGADTPRAYLERCLETIAARPAGWPLSAIDGLPMGIKDLRETRDLPTQMGCAA